jgi:hypothetical protein
MRRELSDEAVWHTALAICSYLAKPGTRGIVAALNARDLAPADRRAVLAALARLGTDTTRLVP